MIDGLYVEESGVADGPLVALVHGSMDRAAGMAKLVRRLEASHRVLRYDRRGYTRSRRVGPPYSVDANVRDLVRLLEGRPAIVFGHSFGGDVALAAAHRHPELVRGVVAFEPPLSWLPWWPSSSAGSTAIAAIAAEGSSTADAGEQFMRRLVGDRIWERLPEATKAERRADGAALVGELTDLASGPPWPQGSVGVPTIVACGEHAREQHVRANEWFGEHVPDAERVVVPGAQHGAHTSHPDEVAALIQRIELAATKLR